MLCPTTGRTCGSDHSQAGDTSTCISELRKTSPRSKITRFGFTHVQSHDLEAGATILFKNTPSQMMPKWG